MKSYVSILLLLLSINSLSQISGLTDHNETNKVSIKKITSNPERYHGQKVTVEAFLIKAGEEYALYLEPLKGAERKEAVLIYPEYDEPWKLFVKRNLKKRVIVKGYFNAMHRGAKAEWGGSLHRISYSSAKSNN
ncbi:hypothetical protein [Robertkochia aurantiaca]|uniref:hypothetical protein n=1 Tax=Robertkochia aurantiaca TaxID=2873700 RepID=UPI001CCA86C9|nr:hypothetical protein [Robertkochia sp. 3YJGBD-33]